jgi:phage repressor protein C with HTH and peptisase S24 domain
MAVERRAGSYLVVEASVPGATEAAAGVLLLDPESDRLHLRFRRDWDAVLSEGLDIETFQALEDDLRTRAEEVGGATVLAELEDSASNAILVTDRQNVLVEDWNKALNRLYRKHVPAKVLEFRTHVPFWNVAAAAGSYGEYLEPEQKGWFEVPPEVRVKDDMFVALVTGRSMLPRIQPGSLCLFRGGEALVGSREGKLVLVENFGEPGENRYTIKRYRSEKKFEGEEWMHERILLEPLNPEFEAWELTEGRIEVRGIFVRVLE